MSQDQEDRSREAAHQVPEPVPQPAHPVSRDRDQLGSEW